MAFQLSRAGWVLFERRDFSQLEAYILFFLKKKMKGGPFWFWYQPGTASLTWFFLWVFCLSEALQLTKPLWLMLSHLVLKRKTAPYLRAGITLSTRSWPGTPMGALLFCWHSQPHRTSTSDKLIPYSWQSEANQNHFTILSKHRQKQGHLQTRKYHALPTLHNINDCWFFTNYSFI